MGNRKHQGSLGMSSRARSFGAFAGGSFTKMVCVLLAGLIIISGQSLLLGASPAQAETGTPWIQSDKDDYPPGGLVNLTGGNWQPGESVHLYVNDDQGRTWERNSDVVADETGAVTESFNLPDWFVATYKVLATGDVSGTATTGFTDGNVRLTSSAVAGGVTQPVEVPVKYSVT